MDPRAQAAQVLRSKMIQDPHGEAMNPGLITSNQLVVMWKSQSHLDVFWKIGFSNDHEIHETLAKGLVSLVSLVSRVNVGSLDGGEHMKTLKHLPFGNST